MRGQMIKEYMANAVFAVCPNYLDNLVAKVNSGEIAKVETSNDVSPSHGYERTGSVGIVSIDGATIKKNTFINAMCGGFVGYDTIAKYIGDAEADDNVKTILFHIDSVGGEVAGVDEVQELIATSTKETVTLYSNVGASASIWYGSASDKIYATEQTRIGSIGVKAGWRDSSDEGGVLWTVSKRAKNKDCSLNGNCEDKIISMINDTEDLFYKRVTSNTGMTDAELEANFNQGETITANKAFEIGFLDGVTSKKKLLESLNSTATMPSTSVALKQEKIVNNNTKGTIMAEQTEVTIESLQAELATKDTTIETLQSKVDGGDTKLAEALAENAKLKEEVAGANYKLQVATYAVAMGIERGASKEVILDAMTAEDKLKAGDAIAESIASSGATVAGEKQINSLAQAEADAKEHEKNLVAYAESNKIKG